MARRPSQTHNLGPGLRDQQQLLSMLEQMSEESQSPMVRLGDASNAAPFTFRGEAILCVPLLLRVGRATFGSVMSMYRLTAVNSIVTAFCISVLTLDGVKLGDVQMSLEMTFVSILFMLISRAKPSQALSADRPACSIFALSVLASIALQTALHLFFLVTAWQMATAHRPPNWVPDVDGLFKPNLVNTVVFLMMSAQHVAAFIGNYNGPPFMEPLVTNEPLCNGLIIFLVLLFTLCSELIPDLNEALSLVPFPNSQFRNSILLLASADVVLTAAVSHLCEYLGRKLSFAAHWRRAGEGRQMERQMQDLKQKTV
eukprot:Selendium_serpulae@DN1699_c0_g1_i1.p1